MSPLIERIQNLWKGPEAKMSYREAKKLAADVDPKTRCKLAERTDINPEILYFLSADADPDVRREIAKNPSTPRQADAVLATDESTLVRSELVDKIARLVPDLSDEDREDIRLITVEIMEKLARDQMPKIRQTLAKALFDVADAPRSVILQLAQDEEIIVSGPILENSSVLNDEDLLFIIDKRPPSDALRALSMRPEVSERISDAIVNTESKAAITALLANDSAQIREETLDELARRSKRYAPWQEPIIRRPELPPAVAIRMAAFVTGKFLKMLEERAEYDQATMLKIKTAVESQIESVQEEKAKPSSSQALEPDDEVQIFSTDDITGNSFRRTK